MTRLYFLITLSFWTFNAFAKVECPPHTEFVAARELCQLNLKPHLSPGNLISYQRLTGARVPGASGKNYVLSLNIRKVQKNDKVSCPNGTTSIRNSVLSESSWLMECETPGLSAKD